jgi:glucose/mannose transport system substrate-binding protein
MFTAEAFGLPRGAVNREAALAWLTVAASREGSDVLNPLKGTISARLDSDLSRYNTYSRTAARDFARDRIVGSMIHGVVASEDFMDGFAGVMEKFLQSRNPHQAALAVEAIAIREGIAP